MNIAGLEGLGHTDAFFLPFMHGMHKGIKPSAFRTTLINMYLNGLLGVQFYYQSQKDPYV